MPSPSFWLPEATPEEVNLAAYKGTGLAFVASSSGGVSRDEIVIDLRQENPAALYYEVRQELPAEIRNDVLQTLPPPTRGYVLNPELCEIDMVRFEQEVRRACTELSEGHHADAGNRALDAVSYWQGYTDPMQGVDDYEPLRSERDRLRNGLILAWWVFARAALALEEWGLVVDKLRPVLTALHSEPLWASYAYATYRLDQTTERSAVQLVLDEMKSEPELDLVGAQTMTDEVITRVVRDESVGPEVLDVFSGDPFVDPVRRFESRATVEPSQQPISTQLLAPARPGGSVGGSRSLLMVGLGVVAVALAIVGVVVGFSRLSNSPTTEERFAFDFEGPAALDGWTVSNDMQTDACYLSETSPALALVERPGGDGQSLAVTANPDGEVARSHHPIAGQWRVRPLTDGVYELRFSTWLGSGDAPQTQVGPETSVQMTRNGTTTIAGFQAAPSPWVAVLQIWVQEDAGPAWRPILQSYEPTVDRWVDVVLTFDTLRQSYVELELSVDDAVLHEFDLRAFSLGTDRRGFADGVVLTLEAENLWSCKPETIDASTTQVLYDDVTLSLTNG